MTTITINRATVEQALEALEDARTFTGAWPTGSKAITNLRAALAQQAEPVQEPAFHGFMSDDGTQVDVCFSPSAPRRDGTYATAYYTAPPQRKPLTLEEAQTLLKAERIWLSNNTAFRITRVVERAHGIKE